MSKHRSQEDIIADILTVVNNKPRKTHIMFGANLSYQLLCKYLDKLIDANLVRYIEEHEVYELTKKGTLYLDRYSEFKHLEHLLEARLSDFNEKKIALAKVLE
jgi:predicted transcriptional regulator